MSLSKSMSMPRQKEPGENSQLYKALDCTLHSSSSPVCRYCTKAEMKQDGTGCTKCATEARNDCSLFESSSHLNLQSLFFLKNWGDMHCVKGHTNKNNKKIAAEGEHFLKQLSLRPLLGLLVQSPMPPCFLHKQELSKKAAALQWQREKSGRTHTFHIVRHS